MAQKDLGIVTAYGYAKQNGYTGTEEEFAELLSILPNIPLDATASAGTVDGDLYKAITTLGWQSEVITGGDVAIKKMLTKLLSFVSEEAKTHTYDVPDAIAVGSSWTQLYKHIWVTDGVLYYNIEAMKSSYNANTLFTMAYISSNYVPKQSVASTGCTTDSSYAAKGVVNVLAQSNGELKVSVNNNTGAYFFISGSWKL